MVRALALAAALLAAGCRVDVDGAPCAEAGSAADCPGGQACGNDLRCSARALACAASRCAPGSVHCRDEASARRCEGGDPVCGRWVEAACAERDPLCRILADPRVLAPGGPPPPPGIPAPPECRFGRVGDALAAAAARSPVPATVEIEPQGAATVTFGAATGEEWPLFVASNVTLAAAGPAGIGGAAGAPAVLVVEGAVEGVRVDAEGATTGVRVTAPGARLVRAEVLGAAGAALEIQAAPVDPAAAATVLVLGGRYGGSRVGIWIRGGSVSVAPDPAHASTAVAALNPGSTAVAGNGDGVVIGGLWTRGYPLSGAVVDASLDGVSIAGNGGTGVILANLPPASRVRIARCDLTGNAASDPAPYGTKGRRAGGVLVSLPAGPQLAFVGNRLWANARDQVGVESGTWSIGAPACGPDSNVYACVPPGTLGSCDGDPACAVALSGTGSVGAEHSVWPTEMPSAYVTMNNVYTDPYCSGLEPGVPAAPACE